MAKLVELKQNGDLRESKSQKIEITCIVKIAKALSNYAQNPI